MAFRAKRKPLVCEDGEDIRQAYEDVRNDDTETNWSVQFLCTNQLVVHILVRRNRLHDDVATGPLVCSILGVRTSHRYCSVSLC